MQILKIVFIVHTMHYRMHIIKNNMDINEIGFPAVQEGDKVLHEGVYYIYTNGTFIEEEQ